MTTDVRAGTRRIRAHGLSVVVPLGWDARIERRREDVVVAPGTDVPMGGYVHPVLHMATVALPAVRGDYGSGVVETMGRRDIFVSLVEFDPEAGRTAMFRPGWPVRLRVGDFDPNAQQRVQPNMCGTQRFVTSARRAFCLYVVLGSFLRRSLALGDVNAAIAGIEIEDRPPGRSGD